MATSVLQSLKKFWVSQTADEENLAHHLRVVRAVAMFTGAVLLMRNFGDAMAI